MRRAGLLAIGGAALIAGLIGFRLTAGADAQKPPAPPAAVPVQAAAARTQDLPVYLHGLGTVQAFNTVQIRAQVSGILEQVPVTEGQEVRKGEIVAVIDPRAYQATLDQAVAQRQQDQAQLVDAELDLKRYQNLARSSFAPQQQVDTQRATVDKLAAAISGDSAAIERARLDLGFCLIRSPIPGKVSLRLVDPGNLIEAANQTSIITITQDQPISLVFTLPEGQLPEVQKAMVQGTVPVDTYSTDDQTRLEQGRLLTPNNSIDISTGTIQLKAIFANPNDALWPGEFVNTHLLADTLKGVLTVPHIAIEHGPDGLSVYLLQADSTVRRVPVEIGYDDGARTVVTKGLQAGDKVVTAGQARLGAGTRVTIGTPTS